MDTLPEDAVPLEDSKEEEQLPPQQHPEDITAEYVKELQLPADRFLCKLSDNWPKFKFGAFKITDYDSKLVLVEVPE